MMFPLGELCIIDIDLNKKENYVHLKRIKYSKILLSLFNIDKGPQVVYIPFTYNNIKSIWVHNV
jgi:hypothetical protein